MKLLLVEDNPDNADMLSRRLRNRGFEVLIAEDGHRALEVAENDSPDLILLDVGLPGMGGWDVARALRKNDKTKRIPIIALTAHASQEDREQALEAGCDEFETKPINLDRLLGKIQAATQIGASPRADEPQTPPGGSDRRHALLDQLNHIIGFTELLLEELEKLSTEEIRRDLNKVQAAAKTIVDLMRSDSLPGTAATYIEQVQVDRDTPPSTLEASVLVVDDDVNNRILIVRNLQKNGYRVEEAEDGNEALELMNEQAFDLVICDIVMPRMDGLELLRQIHSRFTRQIPVIVISALDQIETVEQCLAYPDTDFISKPFEPSILLAKTAAIIRGRGNRIRSGGLA
jgi:CheY-like chemotaxis protein